jgi:hypothetical protein
MDHPSCIEERFIPGTYFKKILLPIIDYRPMAVPRYQAKANPT